MTKPLPPVKAKCLTCGDPFVARDARNRFCTTRCAKRARLARAKAEGKAPPQPKPAVRPSRLTGSDRTCPSCKIRHRVPRVVTNQDTSLPVLTIRKYDYTALYRYAALFIEAGGGEDVGVGEACEACGRWSVIAFLDWIRVELADAA